MSEQQVQRVRVKRLANVGLWTADVAAQARFYRQTLGFQIRSMEENSSEEVDLDEFNAYLSLGEEHHCLGLFQDTRISANNGHISPQHSRLHHISFELDTDAELAALAARLSQSGVELALAPRDGNADLGDTLWFSDPDGNRIEIFVTADDALSMPPSGTEGRRTRLHPHALQHLALRTMNLEEMVEFYTEALGFDISDWLLRESVWLRCNNDHHTLILMQGKQDVDHVGYSISAGNELLIWADYLSRQQKAILWGPGRHGAGNDLFLRFADNDGIHLELSSELQQYYDRDVTTPPRLWHSRPSALNLWGVMPSWVRDEARS
jgi:catechol-2,3-dioxygenase